MGSVYVAIIGTRKFRANAVSSLANARQIQLFIHLLLFPPLAVLLLPVAAKNATEIVAIYENAKTVCADTHTKYTNERIAEIVSRDSSANNKIFPSTISRLFCPCPPPRPPPLTAPRTLPN